MTTVLHVSYEMPPLVHGGLGRYVHDLTRAAVAAGRGVGVATVGEDVLGRDLDRPVTVGVADVVDGVPVRRAARPGSRSWADPVAAVDALTPLLADAAVTLAREVGATSVEAHDWLAAPAAASAASRLDLPLVLALHATEHGRRHGRLDGPVPRAVHEREVAAVAAADEVLVCSASMVREAQRLGADPARVHVVAAAVDAAAWDPSDDARSRARQRWSTGPLVVTAGRLEWEKGVSTVVRALPEVLRRHPGARLVVAGTGSYEPVLRALVDDLGLARAVAFAGRLDPADLAALLGAADAVALTSRYEPFGLLALEAQAAGAPLVVTRVGGLGDHVRDGVTGLTVEAGDVDALAERLDVLLRDPALRARLGAAAREAVRRRSWDDVVADTERVHQVAADRRGRDRGRTR